VAQVNRDFKALAVLYQRMGFIPRDVDTKPIVVALENALPEVLNARSVSQTHAAAAEAT
jgi:aarF domain-containing kinase